MQRAPHPALVLPPPLQSVVPKLSYVESAAMACWGVALVPSVLVGLTAGTCAVAVVLPAYAAYRALVGAAVVATSPTGGRRTQQGLGKGP